jgi:asparagine synthase (glutamine-hydrolysing)
VPFLDHHLVEFAAALPPRMKLRGFTTKWILREAVKSLLPASILTRKKMGFPVPFGIWLRGDGAGLARDVLLDSRARDRGITDPTAVARLIDSHARGTADGSDALWSLLNLELWYRTFIDGEGIQTLSWPPAVAGRTRGAGATTLASAPGVAQPTWQGADAPATENQRATA